MLEPLIKNLAGVAADRFVGIEIRRQSAADFIKLKQRLAQERKFGRDVEAGISSAAAYCKDGFADVHVPESGIALFGDQVADFVPEVGFVEVGAGVADPNGDIGGF